MTDSKIIGSYTLTEETEFTLHYETAAWWTTVSVAAGVYDVMGKIKENGEVDDTSVGVALPGFVTENHTPSLFAGRPIGGRSTKDDGKGDVRTKHIRPYAHALAKALLEGKDSPFVLSDRYEARPHTFTSTIKGESREITTYKIVAKNPIPKDPPMGLDEFLEEIGADEEGWEATSLGDLICPCGDTIELDGVCPEGHHSPLMEMGV